MNLAIKAYTLSECMETMADYVYAYEKLGKENLLFCEDRLTLIAERALLKKVGGTFLSSVTTFARFLKAEGKALSKQGSVMLVGEVMTKLQREGKLRCFTSSSGIGKNARSIYETLAQFSASQIDDEVLKSALSALTEDALKKKIADLALIYEGYSSALTEGRYLDESRYLSLLPKRIREEGCLRGKTVFFLGYASFTAQAKETVRAALETAENVVGIFCADKEELYASRAFEGFCSVCKEYGEVTVKDYGVPLEGEAELLRKGLFNPERPKLRTPTEKITIFEAEDKTVEAEYVATKIKRSLVENPDLRYRDLAVLVPSLGEYALPLKKAFTEYGIPYFIDEKKSMKQHPLSKFLLDCFRTVKEGYSPAATQALAQNYFFGESDEYRNYLYKFANYRGGAKRPIKGGEEIEKLFKIERLEEGRNKLLLATENVKGRGYGRDYCAAVRKILTDFAVEEKLKKLDNALEDVAQKGYLAQIYKALDGVLIEAEMLLGNKELRVEEFAAVLEDGFDAMEISLIPLKADAVFVGDITESRIEKVDTLFAVGMTDAVPQSAVDTAIVSDRDIAKLAEVKALLEPTVAEVNLRARECVSLNLCTFTEKMYLSYPLSADGNEPSVSEIFRYINAVFCEESGGDLLRRKHFSPEDFPYRASAPAPAIRQMLYEKAAFEERQSKDTADCSAVFTALKRLNVADAAWYDVEGALPDKIQQGEALFFREGRISPTSLEGYFTCPFGHFAERGLRLKEREESTVLAVDSGNFIHLLLEKTARKAKEFDGEAELRAYARAVGEELIQKSAYTLQQDTQAGAYSAEKILAEGVDVAVAAYRQLKDSEFEVEQTEALVEGKLIFGKIDRIDGTKDYVRIVDYKTGEIDESPVAYYTGRKIQMQLYMSEIMGERIPAGVFYFPASVSYVDEDEGRFRMKGFLNGDENALLAGDTTLGEEKKSEHFSASLKNSARQSKVMDEQTFRSFLDYGTLVAEQAARELKEGYVAPTPYEGSCKYCKYGGMCGFSRDRGVERKCASLSPTVIADVAEQAREEEKASVEYGKDALDGASRKVAKSEKTEGTEE